MRRQSEMVALGTGIFDNIDRKDSHEAVFRRVGAFAGSTGAV